MAQPGSDPEHSDAIAPEVAESQAQARDSMPGWVPRAILLFLAAVCGVATLYWLVQRLRDLLVMLLVSLFLSFAIEPAVNWLSGRGWRRGVATGAVFVAVFVSFTGFTFAVGSVLVDQVLRLIDEAPSYIETSERWINDRFNTEVDFDRIVAEFSEGGAASDLAANLAGDLLSVGSQILGVLLRLLTIMLFTFYLVADGPRLRRSICSALPPARQLEVLRVWDIAIEKTGGYIYSRALLALASMLFHWVIFVIIGVPFPLPMAIWVGVLSQFVPVIGTYLAGFLPLVIATINQPLDGVWVLATLLVYQQIENYLLAPRVTARTMEIHPAVAFGAVIAGASILGPTGALLALPAGATFQAFISTYVHRHQLVESQLFGERERGQRPDLPPA